MIKTYINVLLLELNNHVLANNHSFLHTLPVSVPSEIMMIREES